MDESKTVGSTDVTDVERDGSFAIYERQFEDVAAMRTSLLRCNRTDLTSVKTTLQNITVMRVYHQLARIVRFTEIMDQIEDKMYRSIETSLATMDEFDPQTWGALLRLQTQLQKNMIESQELIAPYLDSELFNSMQVVDQSQPDSFAQMMLKADSREKLRNSAASILAAIDSNDPSGVK